MPRPIPSCTRMQRDVLETLALHQPAACGSFVGAASCGRPSHQFRLPVHRQLEVCTPPFPREHVFEGQNCRAGWSGILKFHKPSLSPEACVWLHSLYAKRFP